MIEETLERLTTAINELNATLRCTALGATVPAEVTTAPAIAPPESQSAEAASKPKGRGRGNKKAAEEAAPVVPTQEAPQPEAPAATGEAVTDSEGDSVDAPATLDDAREVVMNVAQRVSREAAAELVARFGAPKLGDIDPAVYGDLIEAGRRLVA